MKYTRPLFILILSISIFSPASLRSEVSIPVNAKINIFWRFVPADLNPLDIKAPFINSGTIIASKSPFGGGGIAGKQIVSLIKKKTVKKTIIRYRALSLKNGEDPSNRPTLASIVVRDDGSLYDNYVIKTKNDDLALYVDVLVAK